MSETPAHRRYNPLTRRWVLVSSARLGRPWQGSREQPPPAQAVAYDPQCYLCPGNARAHGDVNPSFHGPWAFDNDFPALEAAQVPGPSWDHPLLDVTPAAGRCRVMCYSPTHDASFSTMTVAEVTDVIDAWAGEVQALRAEPGILGIQVFENRGEMMGASSAHPHCQIWATRFVPDEVDTEWRAQEDYQSAVGKDILGDYLALEERLGERLVALQDAWVALVPFWATWPFETLLVPRRLVGSIEDLDGHERRDLAGLLTRLVRAYDRLFDVPFPYSMGIHVRPSTAAPGVGRMHLHFYPPLLRSATIRKFMVGFELFGMPQRDFPPESAAQRLRELVGAAVPL